MEHNLNRHINDTIENIISTAELFGGGIDSAENFKSDITKHYKYDYPNELKNDNLSGIYMIINLFNKKIYVGSSKKMRDRIKQHFKSLRKNQHYNEDLQNDYNQYGTKAFACGVVFLIDDISMLERAEIDTYHTVVENGFKSYNKATIKRDITKDMQH